MLEQEFEWFFTTHSQTLRKGGKWGFEVLMLMSVAHLFGLYGNVLDMWFSNLDCSAKLESIHE